MIRQLLQLLFSTRLSGLLLIVFALAMAVATFIENDFGTETSKAMIYSAKWFEVLLLLLAINFAGNIAKYNLASWEKAPTFLFHVAFIIVILGAGMTKYHGFEGLMTIKEQEVSHQVVSLDSYLQVQATKGSMTKNYCSAPLMMSKLGFNQLKEKFEFEDQEISFRLKKYLDNAQYQLQDSQDGHDYLPIVIADQERRKDFYIQKGTRTHIYGTSIAFATEDTIDADINIIATDTTWMVRFAETTNYFAMAQNKSGYYPKNRWVPLQFKALSSIKGTPFVFNTIQENKIKVLSQKATNPNIKNPESAIVLAVTSGTATQEVTLFGGKGYMNPKTTLVINGLHLHMRYGSKPINLPFSLRLKDFQLERYPGSESPSTFYSDLEVQDAGTLFDYRIFMNNVLDHKGYRFFQSAYLPDESGTILSVNHDYWGTRITYIGYALMTLGMVLSLVWQTAFFKVISKNPRP